MAPIAPDTTPRSEDGFMKRTHLMLGCFVVRRHHRSYLGLGSRTWWWRWRWRSASAAEGAGCRGPAAAEDFLEEAVGECRRPSGGGGLSGGGFHPPSIQRPQTPSISRPSGNFGGGGGGVQRPNLGGGGAGASNVRTSAPASFICPAKAEAECKSAADRRSATAAGSPVPTLPAAFVPVPGAAEFKIVFRMQARAQFAPAQERGSASGLAGGDRPAAGGGAATLPGLAPRPGAGGAGERNPGLAGGGTRPGAGGGGTERFPNAGQAGNRPGAGRRRHALPARHASRATRQYQQSIQSDAKQLGRRRLALVGPAPTADRSITSASGDPTAIGATPAHGDPTADTRSHDRHRTQRCVRSHDCWGQRQRLGHGGAIGPTARGWATPRAGRLLVALVGRLVQRLRSRLGQRSLGLFVESVSRGDGLRRARCGASTPWRTRSASSTYSNPYYDGSGSYRGGLRSADHRRPVVRNGRRRRLPIRRPIR